MANPENAFSPDKPPMPWDSLNSEAFEPTAVVVDNTVRPLRESLRKRLKPPHTGQLPQEPPTETPPESKP